MSASVESPVGNRLKTFGIKKVLVIDDAFDDPTLESLRDDLPDFWANVEADLDALEELRRIRADINGVGDIDEGLIESLWRSRDSLGSLRAPVESLFNAKVSDRLVLGHLIEFLDGLGVEPVTQGTEPVAGAEDANLVFIDYFLGPANQSGVAASQARAKSLYENHRRNGAAPFIVLMSSQREAQDARDIFREASGLLRGLFAFVPKTDFARKELLHYHVSSWAFALPVRHQIQRFVETVERALPKVQENFVRYVRSLGFEDYANIQWLCLQEEGQPLGEYMLWLYRSLLAYLLQDSADVRELQHELDAMEFDDFTPGQDGPSTELAEIFSRAITEPNIGDIGPHPRQKVVSRRLKAPASDPHLGTQIESAPTEMEGPTRVPDPTDTGAPLSPLPVDRTIAAGPAAALGAEPAAGPTVEAVAGRAPSAVPTVPSQPAQTTAAASQARDVVAQPSISVAEAQAKVPAAAVAAGECPNQKADASVFVPMYLSLGDLFFHKSERTVLAVINAACDLAFAPNEKRSVPRKRSILLLRGSLEKYSQLAPFEPLRTELIEYEGHPRRISWKADES